MEGRSRVTATFLGVQLEGMGRQAVAATVDLVHTNLKINSEVDHAMRVHAASTKISGGLLVVRDAQ